MRNIIGIVATLLLSNSVACAMETQVTSVFKSELTISGQQLKLPGGDVEVAVSVYDIPPGAALPEHRHASPRYGYVLSGKLRVSNSETGKTQDFEAGDFVIESVGQWHRGSNPSTEPLKLLVIDQSPNGEANVELRK
ncbi:cupin domain-containing protein [Rhizobium brockwellii]|uniref:cupin domain-containing protein n=1 Tax=Rhizobium TaxID=379 RepID=UPI001031CDA3|nr:cupin domain-containing protein [Rhizobium leguminosarum]TAV41134.1 cupin domain-containing protein [Rhizobium leguminosarum]